MNGAPSPNDLEALSCMHWRSRVRLTIRAAEETGNTADLHIEQLCRAARNVSGWCWHDRGVACRWLGLLATWPRQRERAAEALTRVLRGGGWAISGRLARLGLRCTFAAWLGQVILLLPPNQSVRTLNTLMPLMVLLSVLAGALVSDLIERRRLNWVQRQALAALADLAMPETLAEVARAAIEGEKPVRQAAHGALVPILAATTEEHYGHLGEAVPPLCSLLERREWSLALPILEGLRRFGSGRAVDTVERLQEHAQTIAEDERSARRLPPGIEGAIEDTLAVLRERMRQERDASRLLRPAAPAGSDTLLRPAAGAGPSDEDLLLRAVEGERE